MIIATNLLTCLQISLFSILLVIDIQGVYTDSADYRAHCRHRERIALLKLKAELIDNYGRLSTWRFGGDNKTNCCRWKGVFCDNQTNHVVALDLRGPGDFLSRAASLQGNVSRSLLELTRLSYLDLSSNDFSGNQIPEFIGSLGKLQHLNLSASNFGGPIPHFLGNLSMLRRLDLGRNWLLSDTNLDWLSGIQSLEYLDMSFANLERVTTLPQSIHKLAAVKEVHLTNCQLLTVLPDSVPLINSSNSLIVLDLSHNNLNYNTVLLRFLNISSSFGYIDFSSNNLEGRIPDALGNLMALSHLDLNSNKLDGGIPNALGNLTDLSYLDLSNNLLTGCIPDVVGKLMSLSYIDLSYNQLQGDFAI